MGKNRSLATISPFLELFLKRNPTGTVTVSFIHQLGADSNIVPQIMGS
jgi:hypothetical protein